MPLFVDSILQQANFSALFRNAGPQQLVSLCYFEEDPVWLADAIPGFVDAVFVWPRDDHCRRSRHDVLIRNKHCLLEYLCSRLFH